MSDLDQRNDDLDGVLDENIRREVREKRQTDRENAELKERLEQMERDRALDKAGIPETGPGALLRENYKGAATVDAVRAEAERFGITAGSEPGRVAPVDPRYAVELDQARDAAGAVRATGEPELDPWETYIGELDAAKRSYRPGEEQKAKDAVLNALENGARNGLPTALKVQGDEG